MYKNWKTSLIGLVVAVIFVGIVISSAHALEWIRENPIWGIGVCVLIVNSIGFAIAYGKGE